MDHQFHRAGELPCGVAAAAGRLATAWCWSVRWRTGFTSREPKPMAPQGGVNLVCRYAAPRLGSRKGLPSRSFLRFCRHPADPQKRFRHARPGQRGDRAVHAIRHGLAKGRITSRFPPGSAWRCACLPACPWYSSAHCCAGWCDHENRNIGSGIARLTCAWRLAGHHIRSRCLRRRPRRAAIPLRWMSIRRRAPGPSIPVLSSTTITHLSALHGAAQRAGHRGQKSR